MKHHFNPASSLKPWAGTDELVCQMRLINGRVVHGRVHSHATGYERESQRVNWVLDADIRSFFDSVDHEWLLRMVAHRIADPRILRLIGLWLRAGVLESGEKQETDRGTPQGAGISPLLANVFLHYILDLWAHQWRRRHAHGRVVIVRYADDFVMGFEKKADAEEMLLALKARLAGFGLTLHEDKTRLIEFGRFAALSRQRRGERRPETFAFLGFTHYCGRTRDGRFIVKHKTEGKRLTRKLTALRQDAWRLMHAPMAAQHRWSAWTLRLLRQAAQLPSAQRIPSANAPDMATLSETAQPEKPTHGLVGVRDLDGALPPANSAHHSNLGASKNMTQVTLGKSRVRESRPPGSVRAKAEWLSYSTTTQFDPDDARKLEIFFSARTQRLMREAGISET